MDGVIVVDKPAGRSSFDVVRVVRALPGVKKAGHTGTLDPLATGVLPVCLNEATKLVQFLSLDSKDYRCTMLLGVETDTLDVEGKVLTREEVKVGVRDVEEVLKGCTGEIEQVPPRYSALKYRGKTFYSLVRKGIDVQPAPRRVVRSAESNFWKSDCPTLPSWFLARRVPTSGRCVPMSVGG